MKISGVKEEVVKVAKLFPFIRAVILVDETDNAVKYRLEIDEQTFIQIYQNVKTGTINYLLIRGLSRIFGRDCCGGRWHKHPFENPMGHDFSTEGSKPVSLYEFLKEVEEILIKENLL